IDAAGKAVALAELHRGLAVACAGNRDGGFVDQQLRGHGNALLALGNWNEGVGRQVAKARAWARGMHESALHGAASPRIWSVTQERADAAPKRIECMAPPRQARRACPLSMERVRSSLGLE